MCLTTNSVPEVPQSRNDFCALADCYARDYVTLLVTPGAPDSLEMTEGPTQCPIN